MESKIRKIFLGNEENKLSIYLYGHYPRQGVNFINIICAAFALEDPKSAKKTFKLSVFFALLGSSCTKAAREMLMKFSRFEVLVFVINEFSWNQWFERETKTSFCLLVRIRLGLQNSNIPFVSRIVTFIIKILLW